MQEKTLNVDKEEMLNRNQKYTALPLLDSAGPFVRGGQRDERLKAQAEGHCHVHYTLRRIARSPQLNQIQYLIYTGGGSACVRWGKQVEGTGGAPEHQSENRRLIPAKMVTP